MRGDSCFDAIASHFDTLVAKHGYHPCGCDYGDFSSQRLRFSILTQATDYSRKSVLDVGSGFGDFADYLKSHFSDVRYSGVDISREMVRMARERHPGLNIRHVNILDEDPGHFDIVVAVGIFYLLGSNARTLMRKIITRMFELANETVAFSTLSARAPVREPGEFFADPADTFNFCQSLCERVVLRHDYLRHDFTIYMYKSAR
ncbi:MAG: class I SAM-dependent methyltransferase [Acidobacteriota bacterium]|jgi:SAM-dependent methyltransferase